MKPLHALLCLALAAAGWTAGRRWHARAVPPVAMEKAQPQPAPPPSPSNPEPRGTPGLAEKLKELAAGPDEDQARRLALDLLAYFPPADLPVVQAWYDGLPPGDLKEAALTRLLPVLARQSYPDACALVSRLPADDYKNRRSRTLWQLFLVEECGADQTPASREARLAAFPAADQPELRAEFQARRLLDLSTLSPSMALAQLETLPEERRADVAENILARWVGSRPEEVARHLEQRPPELGESVLFTAVAGWCASEPARAAAWVESLPEGGRREAAIGGLVSELSHERPAEAVRWAARLTSPVKRAEALQRLTKWGRPSARESTRAAIVTLPISPEEKAQILSPSQPPAPEK